MIDAAKYADLVLLMVDGGFGFEMETFEFLNLLQVHPATPSSFCTFDLCNIAAPVQLLANEQLLDMLNLWQHCTADPLFSTHRSLSFTSDLTCTWV